MARSAACFNEVGSISEKSPMSITSTFRRQHDALELLSGQLADAIDHLKTEEEAQNCARIIGKMTGILTIHLAAEDKSLYPRMISSKDPMAAQTARKFAKEMGGLSSTYSTFEAKWRSGSDIMAGLDEFQQEARMIIHALAGRIKRENEQLYPLADKLPPKSLIEQSR